MATGGKAGVGGRSGWSSIVVERLALPALILMTTALSASVQLLVRGRVEAGPLAVTVLGLTALLSLLRLMDDLKDLEKDRVAHPDRPLARGALPEAEARRGVRVGVLVILGAAVALAALGEILAGGFLALCATWAVLMYREFFRPELLGRRPLLYAVSHQVVVLPMYGFAAAAVGSDAVSAPEVWWFAATGLGASFTWEVCRKLDPAADPILGTYLVRLGPGRTVAVAALALALVAVAAARIGVGLLLWPVVAAVLVALVGILLRPAAWRWAAGTAGLLVALQPLAPTLRHFWSGS